MPRITFIWIFLAGVSLLVLAPACHSSAQEKQYSAARYFTIGEDKAGNHQWDEALEAFDLCLQRDPSYADAYYSRGLVREHFNNLEEALTDYNIYLELRPDHYEAMFNRAQIRLKLGQYELAHEDFLKLLRLPPGQTTTVFFRVDAFTGGVDKIFTNQGSNKGYLFNYLGLTEMHLEQVQSALVRFDSAITRVHDDPDLFVNRGMAKEKAMDTTGAILDYQKAISLRPGHALAKHNLGVISKKMNPNTAIPLLDEAINENPNMPFAYVERAYAMMEKGRYNEALADYNEAIRIDSSHEEYFLNRGLVREKLKDWNGAYADYTKAIILKERYEKAWLNRGNLLSRINRLQEAIEDYTVAITYSPGYAAAYYNRAMARNRLHQDIDACNDLRQAEVLGASVPVRAKQRICR